MKHFDLGGGVVQCEVTRTWVQEAKAILEVLRANQSGQTSYKLVEPMQSSANAVMREQLLGASPFLAELALTIQKQLASAVGVYIPSLGLEEFDVNTRSLLTYALATCIGNPSATDGKRVIWDVKPEARGSTYFSTFSETDREAAFHTDTQYYPIPEPIFLLYCMTPARCFGGLSSICDARALRQDIERKDRWVSEVLSQTLLPFRVPSAFVTTGDPDAIEATLAPIFAQTPFIRYRHDTLAEGLKYFPEYSNADVHRALKVFEELLNESPHRVEFFMPVDSLLVVDNHRALHARTAFQDAERHLLRIRVNLASAGKQASRYSFVSRTREALTC